MVTEIVRQAIQLKMRSRAESPLISEAEYCCACGLGLRLLGDPKGLLSKVKAMDTVHEVKETVVPLPEKKRLFHMLAHSRVEGDITEEIRTLFDPA